MKAFIRKYIKNGLAYASIGLFMVGGIVLGSSKIANAFVQEQTDYATAQDVQDPSYTQYIGTTPNGTINTWTLRLKAGGNETQWASRIFSCTSSDFISCPGFQNDTGFVYASVTGVGTPQWVTFNPTPFTTSVGRYYFLGFQVSTYSVGTHATSTIYGSATDTVPGGCLWDNNFSSCATVVSDAFFSINGTPPPDVVDTSTHFISVSPSNGTTTATTSAVGAVVYANPTDFPNYGRVHGHFSQDSAFACQNSGAVYDAVYTCTGANAPAQPFDIDFSTTTLTQLVSGQYSLSQTVTFPSGGNWTAVYDIDQVSYPWYFLGLFSSYNTLVSTTTHFTIGQLSPMDIVRADVASSSAAFASTTRSGIGAILASTTASLLNACNPFSLSGNFSLGDCLTLTIWPGQQALSDDFTIIKQTPPWGYVFRVIDLINATTSTTTLPTIDYSFASSSPMAVMGNIHFDPFGSIAAAGSLINEMHSDQAGAPTVWTILMPIVNIFVYLVLAFMIVHDLTGIHGGDVQKHDGSKD